MAKVKTAEFTLSLKENKYKGNSYPQLVGSFKDGKQVYLVSIQTDEKGNPKFYTSEKGVEFIYARAVSFADTPNGQRKRKNEM